MTMAAATKQSEKASLLTGDCKLHFALAAVVGVVGVAMVTAGPSLTAVAAFFGPLVISTVFLLAAIAVLFWISPPPKGSDDEDLPGQELMQYVAGNPVEISCGLMNLNVDEVRQGGERVAAGLSSSPEKKEEEP